MWTMIIICGVGCFLCILAPVLMWAACERMDDRLNVTGIASLLLGEILIWIYLAWFFMTRV